MKKDKQEQTIDLNRRNTLQAIGAGAVVGTLGSASVGTASADEHTLDSATGTIELLGHNPGVRLEIDADASSVDEVEAGTYTQASIRDDGEYAVQTGAYGTLGSMLFDLSDPEQPELLHRVPSSTDNNQNGIKFLESVDGIYLRGAEPQVEDPDDFAAGVTVVDYGWGDGTPEDPEVIAEFEVPGGVHKLDTHREEPVAYLSNAIGDEPGTWVVDFSDPANPEKVTEVAPPGYNHAPWVDMEREYLYSAYISGDFTGFTISDISDPYDPQVISQVSYEERPDYTELGEPGFEGCHFAGHDPERDLLIVGDEIGFGVPGGKHVWDIGWGDGSVEDPVHLSYFRSPQAEIQDNDEPWFWTTHMHDVIPASETENGHTLLVDGGYHDGTWVCDITDPTDPKLSETHLMREGDVSAMDSTPPAAGFLTDLHVPNTWSAEYNAEKGIVLAGDCLGGVYTFDVSDEEFEFLDARDTFARLDEPIDLVSTVNLRTAIHYWREHRFRPNSGGLEMDTDQLREVIEAWRESQ